MGAVEVRGLREFRRDLKAADDEHAAALTRVHREIASRERQRARNNARSGTRLTARAASGIGARATATSAALTVNPSARAPMARAAFWGTLGRSGWNLRRLGVVRSFVAPDDRQHPVWVGSSWEVAKRGEGPYVLNYTLAEDLDDIERLLADRYMELQRQAFPGR